MMATDITIEEWDNVYPVLEDTLLLAENIEIHSGDKVLEIGCGTGYVSITAALAGAEVEGVDINPDAVELSTKNAMLNGVSARFFLSDIFEDVSGSYDVIMFNPPYLPSEDFEGDTFDKCWDGGNDGREATDRFLDGVCEHLNPDGRIYLLQSSLSGHETTISRLGGMGMSVEVVAEKRLFFEQLFVIRASMHSI